MNPVLGNPGFLRYDRCRRLGAFRIYEDLRLCRLGALLRTALRRRFRRRGGFAACPLRPAQYRANPAGMRPFRDRRRAFVRAIVRPPCERRRARRTVFVFCGLSIQACSLGNMLGSKKKKPDHSLLGIIRPVEREQSAPIEPCYLLKNQLP